MVANQPSVRELYANQLISEGLVSQEEVDEIYARVRKRLDEDFEASKAYKPNKADWLEGKWTGITTAPSAEERKGREDPSGAIHDPLCRGSVDSEARDCARMNTSSCWPT